MMPYALFATLESLAIVIEKTNHVMKIFLSYSL